MRKRSKYRPRPVLVDPVGYTIESMKPVALHDDFLIDLKIKNALAMQALIMEKAEKSDMDNLISMNNVVHALLRMGFGTQFKEYMNNGREALLDVCRRGAADQKFICRGPQITALNELLELHDAQMEVITVKDMERAIADSRKDDYHKPQGDKKWHRKSNPKLSPLQ